MNKMECHEKTALQVSHIENGCSFFKNGTCSGSTKEFIHRILKSEAIDIIKSTVKMFEKLAKGYFHHKTIFCHKLGTGLKCFLI